MFLFSLYKSSSSERGFVLLKGLVGSRIKLSTYQKVGLTIKFFVIFWNLGFFHASCFALELGHFGLKLLPKRPVTLLIIYFIILNPSRGSKINLKCEIGLELVVDLVGLGLDLLHCLLHPLPRLHVGPVAIRLRPDVLPQPPEQDSFRKQIIKQED